MPIPLFDAHCDTIWRCWAEGVDIFAPHLHACAGDAALFEPYTQIYALWTNKGGEERYAALMQTAGRELKRVRHRCILSIEGAEGIGCDAGKLPAAYEAGVRAVNLVWNYDNALAGAAMDGGTGLSGRGAAFVRACEELGIYVDVSHLSDAAFWQLCEIAQRPVIASHSNSRTLCPAPRNLTDEQFLAIRASGGCVGLNYYTGFLGRTEDVEAVVDHAEHFLALGGEKNLGLGSDFDGSDIPEDLSGLRDVGRVYDAMLRRNWAESLVRDIFCNNFGRLFDEHPDLRTEQVL